VGLYAPSESELTIYVSTEVETKRGVFHCVGFGVVAREDSGRVEVLADGEDDEGMVEMRMMWTLIEMTMLIMMLTLIAIHST
jgi:hypothetical protein